MEFSIFSWLILNIYLFFNNTQEEEARNSVATLLTFRVDTVIYFGCICRKSRTALIILLLRTLPERVA